MSEKPPLYVPTNPVRFVTAASLFDGHDVSINIMRRILQSQGAEVVHLGHDRSVDDVVTAAIQEDVQGVALSSYQGGHVEYFSYLVELLRERGAGHIRVYGGGGGVIVPAEIALLAERGVRIFSPEEGQALGLVGMVNTMIRECDVAPATQEIAVDAVLAGDQTALARAITILESGRAVLEQREALLTAAKARTSPVLGITGTGGSGKSSLTDELVRRFRLDQEDKLRIAVIAVDPTRRRGGGALLGDRIRMNSLTGDTVYFRSLATRGAGSEVPEHLADVIAVCRAAGHDLVIVETPGIGQGDAAIVEYVTASLYVMTPEYGAASQLEKIDMLDCADAVALNKFERRGADDARRDVARQLVRNREAFGVSWEDMPVFGTSAARFDDDGVTALYQYLRDLLAERGLVVSAGVLPRVSVRVSSGLTTVVPASRVRYLAEVSEAVRGYHRRTREIAEVARRRQHVGTALALLAQKPGAPVEPLVELLAEASSGLDAGVLADLAGWPETVAAYQDQTRVTLSGTAVPRVALPRTKDDGELVTYLRSENVPGRFPFTAGVFAFKREGEAPARMFAGEGDPFRTNRRFHLLAESSPATRRSTAFDSVTL